MPYLKHNQLEFHYLDRGAGVPMVFQHGLGGDSERVFSQIEVPVGFRLLGLDCRGHGKTKAPVEAASLRFDTFADDLRAWLDDLHVPRAVIGGTSMGAGVALNFALRYAQRTMGLVLLRPAWLDRPNEANTKIFNLIARLLRQQGAVAGLEAFKVTAAYAAIARESPDSANSLQALFNDPRAVETVERLECIPKDAPNHDRSEWRRIAMPVLVMANRHDPVHPFDYGHILAETIPGCQFKELTPKSVSLEQYLTELHVCLADFLNQYLTRGAGSPKNLC